MIIGDVFIMEEREFIDIVGADGTTQKMELIAIVESKKDKVFVSRSPIKTQIKSRNITLEEYYQSY